MYKVQSVHVCTRTRTSSHRLVLRARWQVCAAKGLLPSQSSRKIVFARAPNTVRMDGSPPFGVCSGFTDRACDVRRGIGFANDDIYYLEVCLYSQICANGDALFGVKAGEVFFCEFSESGFRRLQAVLLDRRR